MGRRVLSHFDHVDVVVANAGSTGPIKPLHLIEPSEWRDCVAVNLDGTYLTFRRFIPGMLARRAGSLIAISSASGKRPTRDRSPYAAAKLGVIGLVRGLGLELGPYGIRVNSVCPGVVEGARLSAVSEAEAAAEGVTTEEIRGRYVARSPLGRLVDAVEVARACVFLASDDASAITGEDLNVSAGALMY
jgi:NAD(P)-dependent dehydrogenase (short-subunit alcohol dehydrogenase family)